MYVGILCGAAPQLSAVMAVFNGALATPATQLHGLPLSQRHQRHQTVSSTAALTYIKVMAAPR